MKKFWIKKAIRFTLFALAATALLSFVVMSLWNAVLVTVLGVKTISFWQALGILVLSKILFGGFRKCRGGRNHHEWKEKMKEKWEKMTPEEREKFKEEWQNKCRMWNKKYPEPKAGAE